MKIIEIPKSNYHNFVNQFIGLRKKCRPPEYDIGGPSDEQVKALIPWGLQRNANFWMVVDENQSPIGRICARISPMNPSQGTIGLFEIDLKSSMLIPAFNLLIDHALSWLKSSGAREVLGPIDLSTWFTYRLSCPSKKFWPRYSWEPTTPPEYLDLFKKNHFVDEAYYQTVYYPTWGLGKYAPGTGAMKTSFKELVRLGFTLRPFNQERFVEDEVPLCHEISHDAFQGSYLFEPIDLNTFSSIYAKALKAYDFSPSCVLISPTGEVAGFLFAFIDQGCLVIKSLALKKKFQGMNISSGMIYHAVSYKSDYLIKGVFSALVKTGLASERIAKNASKTNWFNWTHDYVLLKKEI